MFEKKVDTSDLVRYEVEVELISYKPGGWYN